jgi:hypothetical protein
VDAGGNVIVTGYSTGGASNYDYLTIKYSGAGVPLWTNRYNGPGNGADTAAAAAIDGAGHVFVTGTGTDANSDYTTLAYSATGVPLWTNRYSGIGSVNHAYALTVDSGGNVLVTGGSTGNSGGYANYDYATIKYSSSVPPPPHLNFLSQNKQLVLSWTDPTFGLQTAPEVFGTYTNIPGATSPYTNAITGNRQFFRLISN